MPRTLAAFLVVLALAAPSLAWARSPLKAADMTTIRKDARSRARSYARTYRATDWSVTCAKMTPYTARCRIRLIGVRRHAAGCVITTVYAVAGDAIEGNLGRN